MNDTELVEKMAEAMSARAFEEYRTLPNWDSLARAALAVVRAEQVAEVERLRQALEQKQAELDRALLVVGWYCWDTGPFTRRFGKVSLEEIIAHADALLAPFREAERALRDGEEGVR